MRLKNSITMLSFLAALFLSTVVSADEAPGYISINAADLPPDLTRVPPLDVPYDQPPAYGAEDPSVVVVIFADYLCPACRRASQASHRIASEFPDTVRFEFMNNALASHENADLAAIAGLAAQRQDAFWEMHDELFKTGKADMSSLENHALSLNLDVEQFLADMEDPALRERIEREQMFANTLGATNTPSYLVNGDVKIGWGSWGMLKSIVAREVAKAKALADQGLSPQEIREQRALDNNSDSISYDVYSTSVLDRLN